MWHIISIATCKVYEVTYRGRHIVTAISQMTFSNVFTWIEMIEFRLIFHWGLFLTVHLTRSQLWSGSWIGVVWRQVVIWTNDDPVQWRIYVSPDLNELKYIWSLPGHRLVDAVFVHIYWTRIVCKFHRILLPMVKLGIDIGSGICLVPITWQPITCTNVGLQLWRNVASPGHSEYFQMNQIWHIRSIATRFQNVWG